MNMALTVVTSHDREVTIEKNKDDGDLVATFCPGSSTGSRLTLTMSPPSQISSQFEFSPCDSPIEVTAPVYMQETRKHRLQFSVVSCIATVQSASEFLCLLVCVFQYYMFAVYIGCFWRGNSTWTEHIAILFSPHSPPSYSPFFIASSSSHL